MGNTPVNLLLLDCLRLGEAGSLERILESVQGAEFTIVDVVVWSSEGETLFSSTSYNHEACENMAIAYERRSLSFIAMSDDNELGLGFKLGWMESDEGGSKRAWIHAYCEDALGKSPKGPSLRFLHLGRRLYPTVRPRYGWIERLNFWKPENAGYTTRQDVENLEFPHVYWANFFSPEYVNRLGKEFLMQAPGWKHEELDDGGVLYVLSPNVGGRSPIAFVREVQSYFGVEHVRRKPRKGRKRGK